MDNTGFIIHKITDTRIKVSYKTLDITISPSNISLIDLIKLKNYEHIKICLSRRLTLKKKKFDNVYIKGDFDACEIRIKIHPNELITLINKYLEIPLLLNYIFTDYYGGEPKLILIIMKYLVNKIIAQAFHLRDATNKMRLMGRDPPWNWPKPSKNIMIQPSYGQNLWVWNRPDLYDRTEKRWYK